MAKGGTADVRIEGLNRVLRALRSFPPEANKELKSESRKIADRIMVPAYQGAARRVPTFGDYLADSIRSRSDRLPAIQIGYQGRRLPGGANSIMLRWPTHSGDRGASRFPFERTGWINQAKGYKPKAVEAWGEALTRVVTKWNRGL